jgi:hypothetical protein
VLQLTPEGMHLFDAAVADRAGVRYGCVAAGVPTPSRRVRAQDLLNPQQMALRAVFGLLHALASRQHPRYPYPRTSKSTQIKLRRGLGFAADKGTNDGVVPTLSQLHGRVLHVACADHLDVVGHYTQAANGTANWLPSGAGFTQQGFDALWDDVAAAIARGRRPARAGKMKLV